MTDAADRLLAGAAAYNVAEFRVAETVWVAGPGPLFSGLAALADAVASGRAGEWTAATAAAERARELLAAADPAGISRPPLGRWLDTFLADPESVERGRPPAVLVDGERRVPGTLPLSAAGLAAEALATASEYDDAVITDAVMFAGRESQPEQSTYATFLRDFVGNPDRRPVVYERLSGLVERDQRKERDVSGLFDGEG
ncbi:hypothetical protein [Halolamina sp.]|jgi:hypothetical protein|uniref:hypothetical protein n=1 Tax=Halolamina sp. TaxID=1940283 RepID=UPI000223C082|nr:protein of unknown function DUF309 [halophilic archaeon DL31]